MTRRPLIPFLVLTAGAQLARVVEGQAPCLANHVFDDGTAEHAFPELFHGPVDLLCVSQFTPPSAPYTFGRVCLYLRSSSSAADEFVVTIYDDDGASGEPLTLLHEVPVTHDLGTTFEWLGVDLGCFAVAEGSVWIGLRLPPASGIAVGVDTDSDHPYRWAAHEPLPGEDPEWNSVYDTFATGAFMIRAGGGPGDGTARSSYRNGSGINTGTYFAPPPSIGSTWTANVFHAPDALQTRLYFYARPATGPVLFAGEVLVDLTSQRYGMSVRSSSSTFDPHVFAINGDPALIGISAASQALIFTPDGLTLTNAIDIVVGC